MQFERIECEEKENRLRDNLWSDKSNNKWLLTAKSRYLDDNAMLRR